MIQAPVTETLKVICINQSSAHICLFNWFNLLPLFILKNLRVVNFVDALWFMEITCRFSVLHEVFKDLYLIRLWKNRKQFGLCALNPRVVTVRSKAVFLCGFVV